MRVEWVRLKARADRWSEEEELLQEEMRCVLRYFEWKARWWREQMLRVPSEAPALTDGLRAYAEKQASLFNSLAVRFAARWAKYFEKEGLTAEWIERYRAQVQQRDQQVLQETDDGDDNASDEDDVEDASAGIVPDDMYDL